LLQALIAPGRIGQPSPSHLLYQLLRSAIAELLICPGVAMEMTQQYLAGELSVLLERVQAVATTEAAGRDAWSLRQAAETVPVQALGWVTVRALALTERFCWDSLSRGDTAAFSRQAAAGAALREFGVCASLLRDV
jgi:hypothetical protein